MVTNGTQVLVKDVRIRSFHVHEVPSKAHYQLARRHSPAYLAEHGRIGQAYVRPWRPTLSDARDDLWSTWHALAPDDAKNFKFDEDDSEEDSEDTSEEKEEKLRIDRMRHSIWYRRDPEAALSEGWTSRHYVGGEREGLVEQVAAYLERPWLRHPTLDWIFLGALLFLEICTFGEAIKRDIAPAKRDFLGLNPAYFKAKGNIEKMNTEYLKAGLRRLVNKFIVLVALVGKDKPDLILVGIRLVGDMDGREATQRI